MYLTRTFGRWQVELHQRAIHLTRQPDPKCPECHGDLGGWPLGNRDNWSDCACIDQLRTWRLPLWPRRADTREDLPF
ncbi:hypothetical protein [Streptomyces sp. AC555_RSS877]|uniref:hypothetical protein n=1 Tax=Streptomyces sp. AC555_RSS877 TaxID=2823688 RepID=UPI001C26E4BF|nr:hypothetical protein [Streptomyces sp. AC555_RSS877]